MATSRPLLPLPMAMVHRLHALSWDTAVLSPIFPGSVTSNNAFACIWDFIRFHTMDSKWYPTRIRFHRIGDRRVERVKGLHCNTSSSGSGLLLEIIMQLQRRLLSTFSASSTIISHCNPKACTLLQTGPGAQNHPAMRRAFNDPSFPSLEPHLPGTRTMMRGTCRTITYDMNQ